MDYVSEDRIFAANNDFELGCKNKKRDCSYKIFNPAEGNGLVVYVPGFGDDLGDYSTVFARKIAERYNLSSMVVDYFGINSRPNVGAQVVVEVQDIHDAHQQINAMGGQPAGDWAHDLDLLSKLSEQRNQAAVINASLVPLRGEYQNFGVLAALDIFNAIRDAVKKYGLDQNNIILIGSSYGGYIANLVTKIAPGYIRSVMDNSSWAEPNLSYVVGRELQTPEYILQITPWIKAKTYVKSPWTLTPGLPNSFASHCYDIRSFDQRQLQQMAEQGGDTTVYLFVHAVNDTIANTQRKMTMAQDMVGLNMIVDMTVMDEEDIDGVYVKDLNHGMGLSMLKFFEQSYTRLNEDFQMIEFTSEAEKIVTYRFAECNYIFDLTATPVDAYIDYAKV